MDYINFTGFKGVPPEDRKELIDSRGISRTESLFTEVVQPTSREKYPPLYSLKEGGRDGLPAAYHVYMNSVDETDAALKLVGSMSHWRKLCRLKWFNNGRPEHGFDGLESWRADMAARDASESKRVLLEECNKNNVSAARALDNLSKAANKKVVRPRKNTDVTEEDKAIDRLLTGR